MEKIALVGDLHFSRKAENPIIKKYIREGQRKYFDYLVEYFHKNKIKTVFFTGDIHDTRAVIDVEALVYTKRLLTEKMKDFDVRMLLGNHDLYYENSYDISALELFEDISNVTVYRDTVAKETFFGKTWYIVPWIIEDNAEKFVKFLEKLGKRTNEEKKNTVIFGHFDMFGIDMEGNQNISNFGLDPNLFLNAAQTTVSGHYHGKSTQVSGDSGLYYLGSPYPLTFANAGRQHGFWTIEENGDMKFIENEISPSFEDVWDTDDLDNLGDMSNSFVRLYMSNNRTMEELFEIRTKVEKSNPLVIKKIPYSGEKKDVEEKSEVEREATQILGMDTMKLSEVYIEQHESTLPQLTTSDNPKNTVLEKIQTYKKHLNL